MANEQNLIPMNKRTKSEQRELASKAGKASGAARRAKKSMRETAEFLLGLKVSDLTARQQLENLGIKKDDQNYQTALLVTLMKRAAYDGDTAAIRLLAELTGDLQRGGNLSEEPQDNIVEYQYPAINIPGNGRDKDTRYQLAPQPGPQTMFMASPADIVIYGGAAGGGKTYALLLEALRHKDVKGFGAVIFRKNYNQIAAEGGLWDASQKIFGQVPNARAGKSPKFHWDFDGGGRLNFAHIGSDDDLHSWQGTEITYIGFDELTHFSRQQFMYMLSRNRTTCGIRPYVRATCNPDVDSWVAEFISWWINQETGYPIKERSGQLRYMVNLNDVIHWGNTPEELAEQFDVNPAECKSVTFIASCLEDNKILMDADPGYLANLKAMTEVDMERLLYGNWKIKAAAGSFFMRTQIGEMLTAIPTDLDVVCRGWDLAATDRDENDEAAFTAGVLMGRRKNGRFVVLDVINQQLRAGDVRKLILQTAMTDKKKYKWVRQRLPQDPGQAGKEQAQSYVSMLAGYDVKVVAESGDKVTRAEPMAAQWQHGMFDVVVGEWNETYFNQIESFPDSKWKDMVDAGSSAFNELTLGMKFNIDNLL